MLAKTRLGSKVEAIHNWRNIAISLIDSAVSVNACSIKGDVKEHFSPCTGGADIFPRHPATLTTEAAGLVWCPWCWVGIVPCQQVHLLGCDDAGGSETRQALWLYGVNMVLSEARGLVLFRVVRGGIGFTQRLGARHRAPTGVSHTHPRTRASPEPASHHPRRSARRWKGLFTRDAQAACDFSLSASKPSPFFHRVSVIAAILRASVSRAIVGFIPFSSRAW